MALIYKFYCHIFFFCIIFFIGVIILKKDVFKYRSLWMGLAIFMIVYFHSLFFITFFKDAHSPLISILKELKTFFYGGTDIFLFSSGIGCFFSFKNLLQKTTDPLYENESPAIISFMRRRLYRIAPSFLPFCIIYIAYQKAFGSIDFPSIIGNIFFIQSFTGTGTSFNWYLSAMWLFYILTPYFYYLINSHTKKVSYLIIILFSFVFSIPFWNTPFLIIFSRSSIFIIGMITAKVLSSEEKISLKFILLYIALFIIGLCLLELIKFKFRNISLLYGLLWYPFIFTAPGACILLSILAFHTEKYCIAKKIIDFFSFIGNYTFEIFLIHIFLFNIYDNLVKSSKLSADKIDAYIFIIVLIIPCTVILVLISNGIKHLANRNIKNNSNS